MLITKKKDLSNYTPSANFDDGKRDGFFLSNGERPNPFPEHKLLNGEVELNISKKKTDAAYILKANSNSSNRIKAASLVFQANDRERVKNRSNICFMWVHHSSLYLKSLWIDEICFMK